MRRIAVVVVLLASFLVPVALGSGATPAAAQAPPTVTIGDAVSNERSDLTVPLKCKPFFFWPMGYTGPCWLDFPILVDPWPSEVTVTVEFTAGSATAADFTTPLDPITITLPRGTSQECICLVVAEDEIGEADETITATITAVEGGVIGEASSATGTILDDDAPAPAPDLQVADAGTESVLLDWDPVTPVRGTLTGYTVTSWADVGPPMFVQRRVEADESHAWVAGLAPGATYNFEVWAETDLEGSGAVAQVTGGPDANGPEPTLSDPPEVTGTTAGDGFVTVEWAPPPNEGGAPIVAYSVVALSGSTVLSWRNVGSDVRSASLAGLANEAPVDVHVLAWNQEGPAPTEAVTLTPTASGAAAQGPAVVPYVEVDGHPFTNGAATVTWSAAPERGQPVLGYSVILSERIGGTLDLVEWRTVGPDVRSVELDELTYCYYDVHIVAVGTGGFGDFAVAPDLVLPPPLGESGTYFCETPP